METAKKETALLSACLLGINCKYNGKNNRNQRILELGSEMHLVPLCPEQLGGFPTPRPNAEISGEGGQEVLKERARVITREGEDVTSFFLKGATETLRVARLLGVKKAILKARSPSCGVGEIYSGRFNGEIRKGDGVTTALLKEMGLEVFTEEDLAKWQGESR